MLVLNRKKNQSIVIGNNIEIKILKIGNNFVELGIDAPKDLSIFRDEVFKEIKKQNIQSVKSVDKKDLKDLKDIKSIFNDFTQKNGN